MSVTSVTLVGNLTADPQTRTTSEGTHVTSLRVAVNERRQAADGSWESAPATFHNVDAWGPLAINAAASLHCGDRVVVVGRMVTSSHVKDGSTRHAVRVHADILGADLQFTRAQLRRAS